MLNAFQIFAFALFVLACLMAPCTANAEEMKHARRLLVISSLIFLATHIISKVL